VGDGVGLGVGVGLGRGFFVGVGPGTPAAASAAALACSYAAPSSARQLLEFAPPSGLAGGALTAGSGCVINAPTLATPIDLGAGPVVEGGAAAKAKGAASAPQITTTPNCRILKRRMDGALATIW
jgi:hypothetical protein